VRISVVLPDPLDPTSTVIWRAGMTRSKSRTACVPSGYVFETERNSIIGSTPSVPAAKTIEPYSRGPTKSVTPDDSKTSRRMSASGGAEVFRKQRGAGHRDLGEERGIALRIAGEGPCGEGVRSDHGALQGDESLVRLLHRETVGERVEDPVREHGVRRRGHRGAQIQHVAVAQRGESGFGSERVHQHIDAGGQRAGPVGVRGVADGVEDAAGEAL